MDAFTSPGRSSAEACERENFEAQDGVWGVPAVRMVWGSGVHVCSCLARGVSLEIRSHKTIFHEVGPLFCHASRQQYFSRAPDA